MWLERCCRFPDTTHELQILLITYKPKNPPRESWNKGRLVGPRPPFKLQEIRAMRIRPDLEHRIRELAMLNTPIDSKLRGCDLARLEVSDLMQGCHAISRAPGGAAQDAAARFGRCRPVAAMPPTIAVSCRRRKPTSSSTAACRKSCRNRLLAGSLSLVRSTEVLAPPESRDISESDTRGLAEIQPYEERDVIDR